jgi:hypothetical protein
MNDLLKSMNKGVLIFFMIFNLLLVSAEHVPTQNGLIDLDSDGFSSDVDCDDNNPLINPNAQELDDNIDNNCRNDPPKLDVSSSVIVTEGELIRLEPVASDPDGDSLTFKYTAPFDHNGVWQTKLGDGDSINRRRNYDYVVRVNDGELEAKKIGSVSVDMIGGRDLWKHFKNNQFVGYVNDNPDTNPEFNFRFGARDATRFETQVYMKNKRNVAIDLFCFNELVVTVNGKRQVRLGRPGVDIGKSNSDKRKRINKNRRFVNLDGTRAMIELQQGWSEIKVVCNNGRRSRGGNSQLDLEPRLSEEVDLMVYDRNLISFRQLP